MGENKEKEKDITSLNIILKLPLKLKPVIESIGTIGAGEAFAAGFISNFLKTGNISSAAKAGNLFGAYRVKSQEMCKPNPIKKDFMEFSQQFSIN